MSTQKLPSIAFVVDDRVSRERVSILTRTVTFLMRHFDIEIIHGGQVTENQLLQKLQQNNYQLILAPIHRYTTWNRIDAALGLNRIGGPTMAGYFCEPVPFFQFPHPDGQSARIFIDFNSLEPQEILILVRSLVKDSQRSGLLPLFQSPITVYCENWLSKQGQGARIDSVLALPEIAKTNWIKRSSAIRIILSAFWGLIYEEGPGRQELSQSLTQLARPRPKASFQLAGNETCLAFRLFFPPTSTLYRPKEVLLEFWPNPDFPTRAAQLLLKYTDFFRVHTIKETADTEIVVGLFPSAPSEKTPQNSHTIWIEPLSSQYVKEPLFETPGAVSPHLKALSNSVREISATNLVAPKPPAVVTPPPTPAVDTSAIHALEETIKKLNSTIEEKESLIQELRLGGVGTAPPLPPPDAEALLEAFQTRYFEAKYQIRQFELKISEIEKQGSSQSEIETLRFKIEELTHRETEWIKKLIATLNIYKSEKQNRGLNKK